MANNLTNDVISCINLQGKHYKLKSVPFHATEAEWLVSDYIPKQGELIVYDADTETLYSRYKTGDGITKANALPFSLVTQKEFEIFQNQLSSAGLLKREIVNTLPETGAEDIIYMVKASLITNDSYDEWMYIDNSWELIGNTRVDLSNYVTDEKLQEKLDLIPGYNGTVEGVSAGTGLKITGNSKVNPKVEIDDEVVFVFYCGDAFTLID